MEIDWTYQASERLIVTAVGPAFRLRRDSIVLGRVMLDKATTVRYFSGVPCVFHADGRGNRHPTRQAVEGAPAVGVPVFTHDGDPTGQLWTAREAFEYLQWFYNPNETWIANHAFDAETDDEEPLVFGDEPEDESPTVFVSVEALSLWEALAAVADKGGYDVCEIVSNVARRPSCAIRIQRRGGGRELSVDHQPPDASGAMPAMDTTLTNLFAASVAETVASSVTRPVVLGGASLYEITVELGKAWDGDDLAIPDGEQADPNAEPTTNYYKRYVTGGEDFAAYAAAGRLWDANTDGRYSEAPWSLSVPDVAVLAGQEVGCWPTMPYPPLPCLTRLAEATGEKESAGLWVEVSFDGGTNWQPLTGCRALPGRLGVYITTPNLADIQVAGEDIDPLMDNLFARLVNDAANVKVRMTCCVASPERNAVRPDRAPTAGTCFDQAELFDMGATGQIRIRAASSRFFGGGVSADEADGTSELTRVAADIRAVCEDRYLEGSIPVEWVWPEVRIGDEVRKIGGIEYPLAINAGPAKRYPRVVAYRHHLRPEQWSTIITLDTDRKAGLI